MEEPAVFKIRDIIAAANDSDITYDHTTSVLVSWKAPKWLALFTLGKVVIILISQSGDDNNISTTSVPCTITKHIVSVCVNFSVDHKGHYCHLVMDPSLEEQI